MLQKKPRLASFGRESYVSAAALAKTLCKVRDEGLPSSYSASSVLRDVQRDAALDTPFGRVIQTAELEAVDGAVVTVPFQHPLAFLWAAAQRSLEVKDRLREAFRSPLQVIIYSDGITPGSVLGRATRKFDVIYWSIMSFSLLRLACCEAWMTLTLVRSDVISKLKGGISQIFKVLLGAFFGMHGHDLRRGVAFPLDGWDEGKVLVFGDISMLLGDELSIKMACCCKGHAGTKPCVCCQNCIGGASSRLTENDPSLVPFTCVDQDKFVPHTDDTIAAVLRRLSELSAAGDRRLPKVEQMLGFTHEAMSFVADISLRVRLISWLIWDWMHIYFIAGVYTLEVDALMRVLQPHGYGWHPLAEYCDAWEWPKGYTSCKSLARQAQSVSKMGASEQLSLCPVLYLYLSEVVAAHANPLVLAAVKSGILLCESIMTLQRVGKREAPTSRDVDVAVRQHMVAQQSAYGVSLWLPKCHYALHLGEMYARHGVLLSTFVHERKHKEAKRFTEHRKNTSGFEMGAMQHITCQHLYDLQKSLIHPELERPVPAAQQLAVYVAGVFGVSAADVMSSVVARVHGRAVVKNDVVGFAGGVGEVWAHVMVDGRVLSIISPWTLVERKGRTHHMRVVDSAMFVHTEAILESYLHSVAKEGDISRVFVPF